MLKLAAASSAVTLRAQHGQEEVQEGTHDERKGATREEGRSLSYMVGSICRFPHAPHAHPASAIHPRFSRCGQSVGMLCRFERCVRIMMDWIELRAAPPGTLALKLTLPASSTADDVRTHESAANVGALALGQPVTRM